MKKMYWQLHFLSRALMLCMCIFSLLAITAVEHYKILGPRNYYTVKMAAASLTARAMEAIRVARIEKKIPIDSETDPQGSGLIGDSVTVVTSDHGQLSAKQTTINPNIAAVIVEWLKKIGVKKGDTIAIGLTGSFPALNIAVLSAVDVMGLRPIIVASAASSQWGANIPGFLWLDMSNILNERGIIHFRPVAASVGGIEDRGKGISPQGRRILTDTILHYHIPLINSKNAEDGINKRMSIFETAAAGARIKAYINIGGGTASVGRNHSKHHSLKSGLNLTMSLVMKEQDAVMVRFMRKGVPVINLSEISRIARQYQLPMSPATPPTIGEGAIFFHKQYNPYLAAVALLAIVLFLVAIAWMSRRIFREKNSLDMETPGL